MTLLAPILFAIAAALVMHRIGVWRTASHLDANSTRLADRRIAFTLSRLASALDLPVIDVHVYEIEPVNGLAAPDGRVFLTRGLLRRHARGEISAEELASVVAHELGHVALGHSKRRMIDFTGASAIRTALAMTLGRVIPGFGIVIANTLGQALTARLSRQDEYEADEYAAALMVKAGLGTVPQISLLAKLDRMAEQGGRAPVWLASHPPGPDRIAAIQALDAKWRRAR